MGSQHQRKRERETQDNAQQSQKEEEEEPEDKKRREDIKDFDTDLVGALKRMQEELRKDVAEIYSPPRVTKEAESLGLKIGEAMDFTTGWDFRLEADRKRACD